MGNPIMTKLDHLKKIRKILSEGKRERESEGERESSDSPGEFHH